jgi:glycerol-3-phosphate dehydrogenase (NAD+)
VKCAEAFIQSENCRDWSVLEASMLNGQKLQGPLTCSDVYKVICHHHLEKKMPFFVTVYEISFNRLNPQELIGRFTTETLRSIHYVGDCTPLRQTLG